MNQQKPEEYIAQWELRLAREKAERKGGKTSIVLFRLGEQWLAFPTAYFREVVEPKTIRRIPHRTNDVLLGLVNIRGTLHLCVHLGRLLNLDTESCGTPSPISRATYARMVVIQKDGTAWAFRVDEIYSLHRIEGTDVIPLLNEEKASRGILEWQGRTVDLLDENLLFQKLARTVE
jgi:chemotaxis-related protein WspD